MRWTREIRARRGALPETRCCCSCRWGWGRVGGGTPPRTAPASTSACSSPPRTAPGTALASASTCSTCQSAGASSTPCHPAGPQGLPCLGPFDSVLVLPCWFAVCCPPSSHLTHIFNRNGPSAPPPGPSPRQEHFSRLPAFVRLVVTARPLPHIRALLSYKFDPRVVSPDDLRPPPAACAAALAARLSRRRALATALRGGEASATSGGGVGPLAKLLWEVRAPPVAR